MNLRCAAFSLACTVWLATPVAAQNSGGTNQVPLIKASARTVLLDVVVTRGEDEPVQGLQKQDFQVMEDGKPQTIDFFEERGAKTATPGALKPMRTLAPGTYSNVPPAAQNDSVNVLLIDTLNTEIADQPYVRKQILAFLQNMQPGTRVAIFTLGSRFRFLQGFTSDATLLQAALTDVKKGVNPEKDPAFHSRSDEADDAAERSAMAAVAAEIGGNSAVLVEGLQAGQSEAANMGFERRVTMTMQALSSIARYLAGVPGRKNLIWFAGSFPVAIFPDFQQREQMADNRISVSNVKKTADLLTTSQVAVYPINAEGLANNRSMDAEHEGAIGPALLNAVMTEASVRGGTQVVMEQLANDTGGRAFYNTNDLNGALQRAIEDGTHYYTVAYTPTNNKMDGNFRKIEVKLKTGKYKLAYRRGYNAADAPAAVAKPSVDPLRPLLAFGLPNATELLFRARVIPVSPQPAPAAARLGFNSKMTGAFTRYSIDFVIPSSEVSFAPAQDGKRNGKIDVGVIAYDRDGKPMNWMGGTQAMAVTPTQYEAIQRSGVPAHMEIDLPDGDVSLETGVYDWGTEKAGTLEISLHPGSGTTAPTAGAGR